MQTINNPSVPFRFPIGNGLQTGSEIILSGATLQGHHKQFEVNLKGDGDNVVLHINPRFKFLEDVIVLNNRTYSGWQKEERHRNRFSVGDAFRLRIVCQHANFGIWLNDKEIAQFGHRLSPQMVRSLEVDGDVSLNRVNLVNLVPPPQQPMMNQQHPYPQPYSQYPQSGLEPTPYGLGYTAPPSAPGGYHPNLGGYSQPAPHQPAPMMPSCPTLNSSGPSPNWAPGGGGGPPPSIGFGQTQPNVAPYPPSQPNPNSYYQPR